MSTEQQTAPRELPGLRGIAKTISWDDLMKLPIRQFDGPVCLVATPADLDHARQDLLRETVVGFDTETRPSFRKGVSHPPALVQIAASRVVYLFQLHGLDATDTITSVLRAPGIVKAGVAMADDLRQLKQTFPFEEKNVVDLGVVAQRCGIEQSGVRNLAGIFLGCRITKGKRTSNWASSRLSPSQITYAATDAWICRELFLRFQHLGLLDHQR